MAQPKFIPSMMSLSPEQAQGILPQQKKSLGVTGALFAGGAGMLALILVPTFVLGPWAVKQLKPDWKYGKRLVTSAVVTSGIGLVRQATKREPEQEIPVYTR